MNSSQIVLQQLSKNTMKIHHTIESMHIARSQMTIAAIASTSTTNNNKKDIRIGFVPTMGALHIGHAKLFEVARTQNDIVIASIFINPKQFGINEDYTRYPRTLDNDCNLLQSLGVDHLFAPDTSSMYSPNHCTYVDPMGFDEFTKEGQSRPGHFRGVATIVMKLLHIVQPSTLYLGQKDAVQCCMIQRMIYDMNMNHLVHVEIVPTVREDDGLAFSSRNTYLTPTERSAAPILYQSLCAARDVYDAYKVANTNTSNNNDDNDNRITTLTSKELYTIVESKLNSEPLISKIQYISIDDATTMQPIDTITTSTNNNDNPKIIISIACQLGTVRLIDNIILS